MRKYPNLVKLLEITAEDNLTTVKDDSQIIWPMNAVYMDKAAAGLTEDEMWELGMDDLPEDVALRPLAVWCREAWERVNEVGWPYSYTPPSWK